MKKILAVLLAVLTIFSCTAMFASAEDVSEPEETTEAPETKTEEATEPETEEVTEPETEEATEPDAPAEDDAEVLGARRKYASRKAGTATDVASGDTVEATIVDASEVTAPEKPDKSTVDTVAIEDEDTALAATIPEEAKEGFSWWWLLVLAAVTGVSVEELYRRKKAKENADNINK